MDAIASIFRNVDAKYYKLWQYSVFLEQNALWLTFKLAVLIILERD